MVVATVGHDQEYPAAIPRLFHIVQRHVNGIQQCSFTLGLGDIQTVADLLGSTGERNYKVRVTAKCNQEELIRRIGGIDKPRDRLASSAQVVAHTRATIEDDPDRQRSVFAGEVSYLLFQSVFEYVKCGAIEAGDRP